MKHRQLERKLNDARFRHRFSRHWVWCLLVILIPLLAFTLLLAQTADPGWGTVPLALMLIAEFLVCNAYAWYWAMRRALKDVRVRKTDYQPPSAFPFD